MLRLILFFLCTASLAATFQTNNNKKLKIPNVFNLRKLRKIWYVYEVYEELGDFFIAPGTCKIVNFKNLINKYTYNISISQNRNGKVEEKEGTATLSGSADGFPRMLLIFKPETIQYSLLFLGTDSETYIVFSCMKISLETDKKEVLWVLTNKKETTIKNVPVKKAHEVLAKLGISIEKMKVVDHKNCLPNSAMIKGTRMDERLKKRKPRKSS